MLDEVNMVSGELLKLWHHFVDLIKISPRFTLAHYEEISRRQLEAFWGRFRRLSASSSQNICVASEEEDKRQAQLEKELFQARGKLQLEFSLVSEEWVRRKDSFPIVIETVYPPSSPSSPPTAPKLQEEPSPAVSLHLVVLVHGFQGNSIDMRLIKNNLSVLYPEAAFLCATSNEELTDHDIADMGVRLANEVKNHILEFFPPDTLQRLSFVGHSLGGVIIRAALPKLADLRGKFHAFISFSSPHLGYRVNASSVIEAGIWVLQKVKSSYCLKQLTLADAADPRESCLYRLSLTEGLAHFQHIFLFSSRQDSYGPF